MFSFFFGIDALFLMFSIARTLSTPDDLDLSKLIKNKLVESRRESLENEKSTDLPPIMEDVDLGKYLKFVNREKSINELLKHASGQFFMYRTDEGIAEGRSQFAACSGGPGLGKTTFCRKAFTRAADTKTTDDPLWDDVPRKDRFFPVVKACVNGGRQYRITFGAETLATDNDYQAPYMSLAHRLTEIITKEAHRFPDGRGYDQLYRVLCAITGGNPDAMVVINFDETNMVMAFDQGRNYLRQVLAAVQEFNRERKGFIFCTLSGTNVRPLHDLLKASSGGKAPKEIPLPLLQEDHVYEVLKDLLDRSNPDKKVEVSQGCIEELDFVAQVLGGVPRYIEMLIYSLGEQKAESAFAMEVYGKILSSNAIHPHAQLERVKELINKRYGWTFAELIRTVPCRILVSYSLFQWPISRGDSVGGIKTIGDLETDGVVFVQDDTIVFPLVLLLNFAQAGHAQHLPMLLQKFDVMLSPDENERNSLGIFAMKCSALSENDGLVRLRNLFPLEKFSQIPNRVGATEMSFDQFELKRAKSRVEKRSWSDWLPILAEKGCFLLNCKGAAFADMIIVSKGGAYVVFIQEKQREVAKEQAQKKRKVPTLCYATVKEEHDKCDVSTAHLFVIITDEEFDDFASLRENEIVLSSEMHSAAIGPLLALLRKHNHAQQPQKMSLECLRN